LAGFWFWLFGRLVRAVDFMVGSSGVFIADSLILDYGHTAA
jgi:hypothetical protein